MQILTENQIVENAKLLNEASINPVSTDALENEANMFKITPTQFYEKWHGSIKVSDDFNWMDDNFNFLNEKYK